jgi:hypothetical protein
MDVREGSSWTFPIIERSKLKDKTKHDTDLYHSFFRQSVGASRVADLPP